MFLTEKEVAATLRITPTTARRWRKKGVGPRWVRLSPRKIMYPAADLKLFLRAQAEVSIGFVAAPGLSGGNDDSGKAL